MVGLSFTILSETPCADPHAGCCGERRRDAGAYPIKFMPLESCMEIRVATLFVVLFAKGHKHFEVSTNDQQTAYQKPTLILLPFQELLSHEHLKL